MTADGELLRRYTEENDQDAFTELVHRHVAFVYGSALRQVRDAHAAKDIAQGVFADLARSASRVRQQPVILGWLYTAVHHAAANLRRAEGRRAARERAAVTLGEFQSSSAAEPEWKDIRLFLDDAMHDLRATDREALLLRFFQNRSFAELAVPLKSSEEAARKRVGRALEKLRGALARRGITSTSAALTTALSAQPAIQVPGGLAPVLAGGALAAGAAAAAGAGGAVVFMSTSTVKTGVVLLAIAAGAIGFVIQRGTIGGLRAELASLQAERTASASRSVGFFRNGKAAVAESQDEIERLRAEVARLSATPPPNEAMATWALRLAALKQRLAEHPDQAIPELRFLTEVDWLDATKRKLETDLDFRRAMADLRSSAEQVFAQRVGPAFKRYLESHGNQFPADLAQLQPYLDEPINPDIFQRWTIRPSAEVGFTGSGERVITQREPVDAEFDNRRFLGSTSNMLTTWPIVVGSTNYPRVLGPALAAYRNANGGQNPANAGQLTDFVTTEQEKAMLQRTITAQASSEPMPQAARIAP